MDIFLDMWLLVHAGIKVTTMVLTSFSRNILFSALGGKINGVYSSSCGTFIDLAGPNTDMSDVYDPDSNMTAVTIFFLAVCNESILWAEYTDQVSSIWEESTILWKEISDWISK